jgi:hypothetical protein
MTRGIGDILNKLQKVKGHQGGEFEACCPAHDDKKPSLSLKQEGDRILVKCQGGCTAESIVAAMGLEMSDLFIKVDELPKTTIPAKIVAEYSYEDESGKELYQVVRLEPKSFRQRHRNGSSEWSWNMDGVRRVLYHLPQVITEAQPIFLVEGEKDADALWHWGKPATTSPGGAQNWKPEYAKSLIGKDIIVIPDKDGPGYQYAKEAIKSLEGKARSIQVVILPGDDIKDVSDWLNDGNPADDLLGLCQSPEVLLNPDIPSYRQQDEAITWRKVIADRVFIFKAEKISEERTGVHARVSVACDYQPLGWSYFNIERSEDRVRLSNQAHSSLKGDITKNYAKEDMRRDLDAFCLGLWPFYMRLFVAETVAGDETITPTEFMLRPYIIKDGGTILFAPPGRGKSYTGLLWAVSIDAACTKFWPVKQAKVLFINLERSKTSISKRLGLVNRVLGLPPNRELLMINARGKTLTDVLPTARKAIHTYKVTIIIFDSISRAGLGDLNENVAGNRVVDALSALCPTWLALGHTSRANEEHLFGSIMQDAGADICVQLVSQVKDDGKLLGCGFQITKQNDIGYQKQYIYALSFDDNGLTGVRKAKPVEFPDIEGRGQTDMLTSIMEWILNQDSADATATEVENALGFVRANVSRIFTQSGKFVQTRKVKQSVYYGVKG